VRPVNGWVIEHFTAQEQVCLLASSGAAIEGNTILAADFNLNSREEILQAYSIVVLE
jgi:hypothetical protein